MARRLIFKHAIYDTFNHQQGAHPDYEDADLTELLQNGDSVLNRRSGYCGYFFAPIDNWFVIAFQDQRSDDLSRRGTMYYFDIFWTPLTDIEDVLLSDLIQRLKSKCARSYTAEINDRVEVNALTFDDRIPRYPAPWGGSNRSSPNPRNNAPEPTDEADSSSEADSEFVPADSVSIEDEDEQTPTNEADTEPHPDDKPAPGDEPARPEANSSSNSWGYSQTESPSTFDEEFITQLWEQHRRHGTNVYASIGTIDRFRYDVAGSLREFNFISEERKASTTFDIVGGELESRVDTRNLSDHIEELYESDRLSISNLPRYRDELENLRQDKQAAIQDSDRYDDEVHDLASFLYQDVAGALRRVQKESARTFTDAYYYDLVEDEEDDSITNRFRSVTDAVSGGNRDKEPGLKSEISTETVDDETINQIVENILEQEISGSLRDRREQIVEDVDKRLKRLEKDVREDLAKTVVSNLDDIRTSEIYEWTDPEDRPQELSDNKR